MKVTRVHRRPWPAWPCAALAVALCAGGGGCTPPDVPDAGSALRGGKLISGPARVDLVVLDADGGRRPWVMPETLPMQPAGDGGWQMGITLVVRNVDPTVLTADIAVLDADTLAPLLAHTARNAVWTPQGLECVSEVLQVDLGDGLRVARRTAVLDVLVADGSGRDARTRGVARLLGGPDGGPVPVDAGAGAQGDAGP
jgi:hypothetical protein